MNPDYWKRLHASVDDDLAVVNYPALPASFNRMVDRIFSAAILSVVQTLPRGRAAEIGCGRGRWLQRLRAGGWSAFGMDVAESARPDVVGSATALPLRPSSLDLVLAITVLQHIPEDQTAPLRAAHRALRTGGHLLLVEVLDRPGVAWQSHMYPKTASFWRDEIVRAGFTIVAEKPVEHLPILRFIERIRRKKNEKPGSTAPVAAPGSPSSLKRLIWEGVVLASRPLEPLWHALLPESASHRLFLARR